ncbi:millepora cytotoxin-1 [Biomphalaria glabrata]|uniref:Uncharacterized protein n=1 Tax=Biomphalaria glabrata TaxID=6526 RepID=A0A2C9LVY9_BIOGL|nr:millepora cytotoxin-1 [Biomphalaria glabrata]
MPRMYERYISIVLCSLLVLNTVHCVTYQTEEQEDWTVECAPNHVITDIVSDFFFSDRLWNITCAPIRPKINITECVWSNYHNAPQYDFLFDCPMNSILAGISSFHRSRDRVFKFYCCTNKDYLVHACQHTLTINNAKGFISFRVPEAMYVRGLFSSYDSTAGDRLYRIHLCKLDPADPTVECPTTELTTQAVTKLVNQTETPLLESESED